MFNDEFYPTPVEVIKKMLAPWKGTVMAGSGFNQYREKGYKLEDKLILDPSCGSCHLVDFITGNFVLKPEKERTNRRQWSPEERSVKCVNQKNVYCIELDATLQHIAREKGYRLIHDDFLTYRGDYMFDLILMNPPFSNGDEHLLHAWDILEEGDIVCLLNSETINNPYSERRQLVKKLIEDHGSVEDLGQCFQYADRKTDVYVSLVRLKKKASRERLKFEFESTTKEKHFTIDENTIKDAPALKDVIGNMLLQYDKVKEAFIEYMRIAEALDHYGVPLIKNDKDEEGNPVPGTDIFRLAHACIKGGGDRRKSFNDFCDGMKDNMWQVVFENLSGIADFDMSKFMTHSVSKDFSKFLQHQGGMEFTRENVWNVISMLHDNKTNILERSIVEVFDMFTSYYKENRCYVEGWKTNDKWRVNKKIILPRWVRMSWENPRDRMAWGAEYRLNSSNYSEYSDIDKALCYITGTNYSKHITIADALRQSFAQTGKVYKGPHTGTCENLFFKMKYFMKGTLHLEFKDEQLWREFNLRACAGKAWLPEAEMKEYRERQQKEKPNNFLTLDQ